MRPTITALSGCRSGHLHCRRRWRHPVLEPREQAIPSAAAPALLLPPTRTQPPPSHRALLLPEDCSRTCPRPHSAPTAPCPSAVPRRPGGLPSATAASALRAAQHPADEGKLYVAFVAEMKPMSAGWRSAVVYAPGGWRSEGKNPPARVSRRSLQARPAPYIPKTKHRPGSRAVLWLLALSMMRSVATSVLVDVKESTERFSYCVVSVKTFRLW